MAIEHKVIGLGNQHRPHNWEYANAAARIADTSVVTADLKKTALQLDDNSIWILTATTPTWVQIGGLVSSGLSSLTSLTFTADSDANASGDIDFKIGASNKVQITNAGNLRVYNKIGINKALPTSALHIAATYAINTTAAEYPFRISVPNAIADFAFRLESIWYGSGNTNDVMWWGWNVGGQNASEPQMHFAMEREFSGDFEIHLQSTPTAHAAIRHWTWNIDRATGATTHAIRAGLLNIGPIVDLATVPLQFNFTTETAYFRFPTLFSVRSDEIMFFTDGTDGSDLNKVIRIAPRASDATKPALMFGEIGTNGVALVLKSSGVLGIYNGNESAYAPIFAASLTGTNLLLDSANLTLSGSLPKVQIGASTQMLTFSATDSPPASGCFIYNQGSVVVMGSMSGTQFHFGNGSVAGLVWKFGVNAAKLLIDNDTGELSVMNGTLKTVSFGADDSGGTGYRLMRVPN